MPCKQLTKTELNLLLAKDPNIQGRTLEECQQLCVCLDCPPNPCFTSVPPGQCCPESFDLATGAVFRLDACGSGTTVIEGEEPTWEWVNINGINYQKKSYFGWEWRLTAPVPPQAFPLEVLWGETLCIGSGCRSANSSYKFDVIVGGETVLAGLGPGITYGTCKMTGAVSVGLRVYDLYVVGDSGLDGIEISEGCYTENRRSFSVAIGCNKCFFGACDQYCI